METNDLQASTLAGRRADGRTRTPRCRLLNERSFAPPLPRNLVVACWVFIDLGRNNHGE